MQFGLQPDSSQLQTKTSSGAKAFSDSYSPPTTDDVNVNCTILETSSITIVSTIQHVRSLFIGSGTPSIPATIHMA